MSFGFLKFTSTDLSLHQCSDFEGWTILQCKRGAEAPQQFSTHIVLYPVVHSKQLGMEEHEKHETPNCLRTREVLPFKER